VEPLPPPDCHYLSAALGWLELGNPAEAELELLRVGVDHALHPAVLETWFSLHAARHQWSAALPIAEQIVELMPDDVAGWLHRSYALRRVSGGGLRAAWNALLPALEKFPGEATVAFNLACYACQLGDPERAWDLLYRAVQAGGEKQIVAMALADPDLAPLREKITEYYAVDRC
jgi:Flp pilus assembly protein TadD